MSETTQMTDPFQAIRPYRDTEVQDVLNTMLRDNEFVDVISHYQFPRLPRWALRLLRPFVRIALAARFGDIDSVDSFQQIIAGYMSKMISRTTRRMTCSGIEQLDPNESYLFVSNHRDIAMDPAFVNWSLYQYGMQTVRIAIGDNLLRKPYVSDLMRLNKSFIVKRSIKAPREMMAAMTQLSEYIDHSIVSGHSVWIAQREGRSKDGNDRTDPTLLKMFYMAHRKQRSFSEMVERLNIVPVCISYEFDPCDAMKARELAAKAASGHYEKGQYEDIDSIVKGITGEKGHVHVSFGSPIRGAFDTPEALAAEIDRQILQTYHLHPSNLAAAGEEVAPADLAAFEQRLQNLDESAQGFLRKMYANPVLNQKAFQAEQARVSSTQDPSAPEQESQDA
ncbi:1-acyl-sn-glycerol-3-phosphate acyltransferase [Nitrincola tapanii]|uniref:1-acyl-sn-glycerol-3-phosphate acyltransferase n=1 Tax=Nitrincola tapanii TaxID=1708751 RepID=A0A5A9W7Z6_9GAMM|nr:1-acyl-sn-glycerol-3-phosphate acyltransferase [Nitrincola tapanii]KAA0876315.1 1-acyl-sn-glycerol-3-phosphate acyltransferase [Nitrincola tapanii]